MRSPSFRRWIGRPATAGGALVILACLSPCASPDASGIADSPPGRFGFSLCAVGDVDRDGVSDVAVGAPMAGRDGTGSVAVLSGKSGRPIWTRVGTDEGGMLGYALASPEDVDGDGVHEVVAGAPLAMRRSGTDARPTEGFLGGLALLFSGKKGEPLTLITGRKASPLDFQRWEPGSHVGQRFGAALAVVRGPATGGAPRVLVGCPGLQVDGKEPARTGSALLCAVDGGLASLGIGGVGPGDDFGAAVAGGGDFDGDGIPDLVIGAPGARGKGGAAAGEVRIFSGKGGALLRFLVGSGPGSRLGAAVAAYAGGAGGAPPAIVVGAPGGVDPGGRRCGEVGIFAMPKGTPRLTLRGEAEGDEFGFAVAPAGDVDGDGTPDLLVGSPGAGRTDAGRTGAVRLLSGKDGKVLRSWSGSGTGDRFGASMALLGRSGSDRPSILAVGAPMADGGRGEVRFVALDGSAPTRVIRAE